MTLQYMPCKLPSTTFLSEVPLAFFFSLYGPTLLSLLLNHKGRSGPWQACRRLLFGCRTCKELPEISSKYLIKESSARGLSAVAPGWGGGGVLPYKRLMGMCRWIGSHFHDWLTTMGRIFNRVTRIWTYRRTFSDFWGVLHINLRLANVPECLYCRGKVKCFSFNLKNGSIHKNSKRLSWDRESYTFAQKWPRWGLQLATE